MSQTTGNEQPAAAGESGAGGESLLNENTGGRVNETLLGDLKEGDGESDGKTPEKPAVKPETKPDAKRHESAGGLAPLPDGATDEQKQDFDRKLRALAGVPHDPSEYGDFGFGEDAKIDTGSEDYKYYTKLFHEVGISKSQAKKLLEAHAKYASGQVEHARKQEDAVITEYRAQVKRDFIKSIGGDGAFKEYQETAVRGFKASAQGAGLTKQEITGLLNVMGDDPRFIKIFNGIGKMFREDALITGAAPRAREKTFEDMFADMFKGGR
ncbi:MAG: hypothetical protein LBQ10_12025 [Desulfovibrio sp.]|jgi:hypothetical protein|nr:hypothetical protein [Desulfovibrio sp.]